MGQTTSTEDRPARPEPTEAASADNRRSKKALGLLFLAVFSTLMSQFIFLPVLPPLSRELGLSELQAGLLIMVAALMVVVASPLWGRVSDAWGRKTVLLGGVVGVALSFYASPSLPNSVWQRRSPGWGSFPLCSLREVLSSA